METYLVTFALQAGKNLKERYDGVLECLSNLAREKKGGNLVKFSKTCFLLRYPAGRRDYIRDAVTKCLRKDSLDGRVLVIEVLYSAWTCHWEDSVGDAAELGKRLKQIISE